MSNVIYYVFEKSTGKFMGSGTPYFDDTVHGCTEIPSPETTEGQMAIWNGESWDVVSEIAE